MRLKRFERLRDFVRVLRQPRDVLQVVGVSGGLLRQRDQIGEVARIVALGIGRLVRRILDARQNRVQLVACLGQRLTSLLAEVGFLLGMLRDRLAGLRQLR